MKKSVSRIIRALLLASILALTFNIQAVKADGSWVWVRDTVTGAYGEAVVGTGDAIYVVRKENFYCYSTADDTWTALVDPPNPDSGDAFKTGTALAWDLGDCIYALYGAATSDSRRWFYRYSISSNSWEALANTTADQGEGDAMIWVGIDNCIYATIGGEQRLTYFVRYDPSTNGWSDAPADPPEGMGDGASLVWTGGDFLYGLRGEFDEESPLSDFWRYSVTDDVWTAMAHIPAEAHDGGVGGVGDGGSLLYVGLWLSDQTDCIYALSGNQAYPEAIPDNRTYRYTISTNSWKHLADLPFGIGYYVGCRLGYADGYIYAWQGTPSTWTGGGDDLAKYELTPSPRTWTVDDDGPADFHRIQEAINAANPRDMISVKAGTYYENVVVNKNNLTLVGENPSITVIDGGSPIEDIDVVTITASNVNIRGFTIQHSGPGRLGWTAGIHLNSVTNCNITGNNITNNSMGIALKYSSYSSIFGNNITDNNSTGIGLEDSSNNNNIYGNNITNNNDGIYLLQSSNNNTISKNTITNNTWDSIDLSHSSNNNTIFKNTITNSTWGIEIRADSSFNTISRNTIANNSRGIEFSSSYNTLSGNNITDNTYDGVIIFMSSYHTIRENNITNSNRWGVWLRGCSFYNSFYHNNFINNTQQVYGDCIDNTFWDDEYPSGGNYWDDYKGSDSCWGPYQNQTGSDGIGDTPYAIDDNNRDSYPLMSPYEYWSNPIPGDINKDMKVDHQDLLQLAGAYGSKPGDPNWNPNADLNNDGVVGRKDLLILAGNYGKEI